MSVVSFSVGLLPAPARCVNCVSAARLKPQNLYLLSSHPCSLPPPSLPISSALCDHLLFSYLSPASVSCSSLHNNGDHTRDDLPQMETRNVLSPGSGPEIFSCCNFAILPVKSSTNITFRIMSWMCQIQIMCNANSLWKFSLSSSLCSIIIIQS